MQAPSTLVAAHSMDTEWFAIDDDGYVAVMGTDEEGHMPDEAVRFDDASWDLTASELLRGRPFIAEQPGMLEYFSDEYPPPASCGFYEYSHERNYTPVGFYFERQWRPLAPVRLSELPSWVEERCFRMRGVRFEFAPLVQPLDLAEGSTYRNGPFWSLSHWEPRQWIDGVLTVDDVVYKKLAPDCLPGAFLRWRANEAFTMLFGPWLSGAVPTFEELDRDFGAIIRAVLDEPSLDHLRETLDHHRSREQLQPRLAALFECLARRGPNPTRVWHPYGASEGPPLRVEARAELERLCARGALPLSWLSDSPRERSFLPYIHEWTSNALFHEMRDDHGAMSLPYLPARVLERLSADVSSTLAAESLAREERGGTAPLYYREGTAEAMRDVREVRAKTATDRERAIWQLGFVLDPCVLHCPVLWVPSR